MKRFLYEYGPAMLTGAILGLVFWALVWFNA